MLQPQQINKMSILKDIKREPKSEPYKENEIITLTGKELNEIIARHQLKGRRKMFTFWNDFFCNCEVNNQVRAAFRSVDQELTTKEEALQHVRI